MAYCAPQSRPPAAVASTRDGARAIKRQLLSGAGDAWEPIVEGWARESFTVMQPELPDMTAMLVFVNFFYTADVGVTGEVAVAAQDSTLVCFAS
jgi:hypothetical protein